MHDKVELHPSIAALPRVIQRMLTHGTSNTASCCNGARHVSVIAGVLAATGLIGAEAVSADDLAVLLSNEHLPVVPQP